MTKYSPELILEAIKCFEEEHGLYITPDEANDFLQNLANLYISFEQN